MKIAFHFFDWPNYTGGPLINALRLLPEFVKEGHEVHAIIKFREYAPSAELLSSQGIVCHQYEDPYFTDLEVHRIWEILIDIQPDIYVPNISVPGCFLSKPLRAHGIPTVNTHRSDDANNWSRARFFSDKESLFHTDNCVCVSEYLLTQLKEEVSDPIGMTAIPSGVPVSSALADHSVSDKIGFVYSGRLVQQQKNALHVLEIFINLAQQNPEYFFTMIGGGELKEDLWNRVQQVGMEERIMIKDPMKGDKYKTELARHHFFLLYSDYEGVPGSVMDAMSCGLIPLVKRYPGVDELLTDGESGLIIESEKELIERLPNLLNVSTRQAMSKSILAHYESNFSLSSCVSRWLRVFETLVGQNEKRRLTGKLEIKFPRSARDLVEFRLKPTLLTRILRKLRQLTD